MTKTYTSEQIEFELSTRTPDDVKGEFEITRMRETCRQYDLKPHPLWLSFPGRITLAQIIAAKVSGFHDTAAELERQWWTWVKEHE